MNATRRLWASTLLLLAVLGPRSVEAQDLTLRGAARGGLQGTNHPYAEGIGLGFGIEAEVLHSELSTQGLLFVSFDSHRSLPMRGAIGVAPRTIRWQTDSMIVLNAYSIGIKVRSAESVSSSSLFAALGGTVGQTLERRATIITSAAEHEWQLPARWSFGIVAAAGGELMLSNRVGFFCELRYLLFPAGAAQSGPDVLAGNLGVVFTLSL